MLDVEVVYASEQDCRLLAVRVPVGATVQMAIDQSGILDAFPALREQALRVGIFSRPVALDHVLAAGDRIEIYRRLKVDPKEARRLRVKNQGGVD